MPLQPRAGAETPRCLISVSRRGGSVLEKACGMGRRGNLTAQGFHDLANVTHAIIWQGVAAVMAARVSIAESHQVCEQTRELLADLRKRRSEGRQGRAWRGHRPSRSLI